MDAPTDGQVDRYTDNDTHSDIIKRNPRNGKVDGML